MLRSNFLTKPFIYVPKLSDSNFGFCGMALNMKRGFSPCVHGAPEFFQPFFMPFPLTAVIGGEIFFKYAPVLQPLAEQ